MDHEVAEGMFSAYVDGELGADRAALDEHLASCEKCRGELEIFQKTLGAMHHASPVTPSPEFMDELRSQIHARSRGRFFGARRSYRLEIASLVTLAIALTIYLMCSIAQPMLLAP